MAEQAKTPKIQRDKLLTRWAALKNERSSFMGHYQEITDYLLPRSGRYFVQDRNRGDKRHNSIYDSTGTKSLRILAAGLMAGMTSPARPWFRLTTSDPDLAKSENVQIWLNAVTRTMLDVFQRSNTYRSLHSMYEELGAFGTAASLVLPDYNDVIRHYTLTVGEYCVTTDYRGQVNTLYREFQKTVAELVAEFGYDNCSKTVQGLYNVGNLDSWVTVVHAIEPRQDRDRDATKKDSKNMPWSSCYFELGGESNKRLRESGFREFPALCPRWATAGGDIYGNSPGMEALGDIKQLQHEQLRKAEAIDYKIRPPLQMPVGMKNRDVETLPGGSTYVDMSSSQGIKTMFEVNLDLSHLLADIQDVRERIKGAFYADLFLMLAGSDRTNMTATEVAERHEEKLLMLGPVLERLHNELLDPLINMTFSRLLDAGVLPPPPEELQGQDIKPEFVSMLAQAQRAVGITGIERFSTFAGQLAAAKGDPAVWDNVDTDKLIEGYGDMLGVDPHYTVPPEQVEAIRQARAQAMQQQAQAAQAAQQAQTVKDLAAAKTDSPSALTNVIDMFSGYNT